MRSLVILLVLVVAAATAGAPAHAQGLAVSAQASTHGLGAGVVLGVTPRVNVRGSFGVIPGDSDFEIDDIDFVADIPTFFRATADFYATGVFFLSVGGLFVSDGGNIGVTGELAEPQEFGGVIFTPQQVGTLRGDFGLKKAMPYLGIGFGDPFARRVGLTFDLGVGFGRVPTVALSASGPAASDPVFQQGLEEREAEIQDDIPSYLQYYPVLSLALSIRLGS